MPCRAVYGCPARVLPTVVDVNIAPAVIYQARVDHPLSGRHPPVSINAGTPAVPAIPAHGRRQSDRVAHLDAEVFRVCAQGVRGAKRYDVLAGSGQCTGYQSGRGIHIKSGGQIVHGIRQIPITRSRDLVEHRRIGPHAEYRRAVHPRRGRCRRSANLLPIAGDYTASGKVKTSHAQRRAKTINKKTIAGAFHNQPPFYKQISSFEGRTVLHGLVCVIRRGNV